MRRVTSCVAEADAAGACRQQADESAHQRGLADAVAPEHANDLAGVDVNADALQHVARGIAGTKPIGRRSLACTCPRRVQINLTHVIARCDFGNGAFGEHSPVVQHAHAVGYLANEGDVVLNDDDSEAGGAQFPQHLGRMQCLVYDIPAVGSSSRSNLGPWPQRHTDLKPLELMVRQFARWKVERVFKLKGRKGTTKMVIPASRSAFVAQRRDSPPR